MANDGLIPKVFSDLHPKFRTPYKSNMILFAFVGIFAGFIPGSMAGDLTSIGTLFAFVLVCCGVIVLRYTRPDLPRSFRTPGSPIVPALGALTCFSMMAGLGLATWIRFVGWLGVGLLIYFAYSRHHSHLRKAAAAPSSPPPDA